jgi:hypothetical protein
MICGPFRGHCGDGHCGRGHDGRKQ